MTAPAIILTMIVRDEAHIIRRCIDSVASLVDAVYLHDTGSVDGTDIVARHHCQKIGLPCTVVHEPWVDFGTNRTACINGALAQHGAAYALMIDADEVLDFAGQIPPEMALTADLYDVKTVMDSATYWRPQLFRLDRGFSFKGVVHEFLVAPPGITRGRLDNVVNRPIQDSARNRLGKEKYERDALACVAAFHAETSADMRRRYAFYAANSFRDCGRLVQASDWYDQRAAMGGWDQEVYCALLYVARMQERMGDQAAAVDRYQRAAAMGLPRVEAHYGAIRYHRTHGGQEFAGVLLDQALRVDVRDDGLFVERWVSEVGIPAEKQMLRPGAADGVAA